MVPKGGKFAKGFQQFSGVLTAFQRSAQLERHTGTAQILEGACVVLPLGVHNGNGFGQLLGGQVVVGDHQLNAQLCGQVSFLNGGNAVIHCHNQLIAFICQLLQGFTVQAVAAALAGGQFAAHLRAKVGQAFIQDGRSGNAVHIIIAKDHNGFTVFNGLLDAGNGFVHIFQQERVAQRRFLFQQCGGSRRLGNTAAGQHPGSSGP